MDSPQRKYIGDVCYITKYPSAMLVRCSDEMRISLSYTEYTLLSLFIDHKNYPLTLDALGRMLWGNNHDKNPDSIRPQIARIRKVLNEIQPDFGGRCIRSSRRGFGSYTMVIDPAPSTDENMATAETKAEQSDQKHLPVQKAPQVYSLHTNCPLPDLVASRINGYSDELQAICDQLSQHSNKAAIVGMGGVGKSELAKAVAAGSTDMFPTQLWVRFSGSLLETISNDNAFSIWGCNREDHLKDTDRQYFERKMRILKSIANRHVLIIIDGFDVNDDPDLDNLLSGEYAVLITTRNRPNAGSLPVFQISHFKDEANQIALFREKYKRDIRPSEMDDILMLIRAWHGHTLGICMLASVMRQRRILPGEMRSLLHGKTDRREKHLLPDIIQMDFHRIFDPTHFSESEWYIMQNLALIPESGIPIREFCQWIGTEDYSIIESLIDRSLIIHDSFSDSIHLHAIIVDLILPTLSDHKCCDRFITSLTAACDNAFTCNYLQKLELMDYIQTAYDRTANWPEIQLAVGMRLGDMLRLLGKGIESADFFRKLRRMTDLASAHIWFDSKISHGLLLGDRFEEGSRVALDGYEAYRALLPEQLDWQTQRAGNWLLQRLCEYYRWAGDYKTAVDYGNAAVDLFSAHGTDAAWDIGWSKYHLAYALLHQGNIALCKQHLSDALALFEYVGSQYASGFAMELLGLACMMEGDYPEALRLTVSAGKRIGKLLAPAHPDCGRNWLCQGNIYRMMGNEDDALRCYKNSITAFHGAHEQKAGIVAKLLDHHEIILDIGGILFQVAHSNKH